MGPILAYIQARIWVRNIIMIQARPSVTDERIAFLARREQFGFGDKSQVVRAALDLVQTNLLRRQIEKSAEIYAEIYAEDDETRMMTAAAQLDWPE